MKVALKKLKKMPISVLDKVIGAERPKLYYKADGYLAQYLKQLPQLSKKYRPTPWLSNNHAHLLYFDLIKKRFIHLQYDQIERLEMQDGGVTAIAWYGLNLSNDTPTIVVMHTLTGTPDSMRELIRDLHHHTGWRIALCLRRGHANLPLPVPQMNLFGSTSDLKEQIKYIQAKFPNSVLYGVGSSAGTGLLVRYLGEEGGNTPFKAAFALCPGYNTELGFGNVHPMYSKVMAKRLVEKFILPHKKVWRSVASLDELMNVKSLAEFEKCYFKFAGFDDYDSYTKSTNPIYVFENIKTPLLILNAEDDPVCHIKNFEPYKNEIQNMDYVAVMTTKRGSHCGFYEGLNTQSWSAKLMSDFLTMF